MVLIETTGEVDLVAKAGSTSRRSLDTPSAESPMDSRGDLNEPDHRQPPSSPLPPMEKKTHPEQPRRPAAMVRLLGTNLRQNVIPVVRTNSDPKVPQHSFLQRVQDGDHLPPDSANAQTQSSHVKAAMPAAVRSNGSSSGRDNESQGEELRKDIRDLEELLSKLNPMAEEFVPSSAVTNRGPRVRTNGNADSVYANDLLHDSIGGEIAEGFRHGGRRTQGRRRMNSRTSMAQREEIIRRTVYVSDIDQQVTEEQLAALFTNCGQVVDCRVCGDPNSVLRFAFIEFTDEEGAAAALGLSGTMLGFYPVRVLPSKTAIAPVNASFLPRSEVEREMCARTVYCTNIDKKISQAELKLFFESICGQVYRLRLLGDYHHSTRIAFVEFVMAESAIAALNCSGAVLGALPIRVSPSKTPVRSRAPRPSSH